LFKKAKKVVEKPPSKVSVPLRRLDLTSDHYLEKEQHQAQQKDGEDPVSQQRPPSNKIRLPFSLKKVMLQTFENISEKRLVYDLPSSMSVRKVLGMYVDAKVYQASGEFLDLRIGSEEQERKLKRRRVGWKNLADGIAMFFEKASRSSRLLYPQEVPQLNALLASSKPDEPVRLADVYGCEHLLRLMLILPDILKDCFTDEKTRIVLHDVTELVKFLHRQQDYLFVASFRKLTHEEIVEIEKQPSAGDG
jgi:MRG